MSIKTEMIATGREWLAGAPAEGIIASGLAGWNGQAGFVCAKCAGRIHRRFFGGGLRGCNIKALLRTPVWGKQEINELLKSSGATTLICVLCW